ncbi:hypothetical protein ES705_15878 [subsurface metagenome]
MINLLYNNSYFIILIPIGLLVTYYLLKYPEISLAIFINAYVIKGGINIGYFNLTAILLIITVTGFIFKKFSKKEGINFKLQLSDKYLIFFVAVLAIGCIYSLNRNEGIIKTLRFIVIVFIPYLLARIFIVKEDQIKLFLRSISIITLVISFLLITISIFGKYTGGRMGFLKANPIPVSVLLIVGLVIFTIGITQNIFNEWKYGKLFCAIAIIPLLYSIFLVSSRGPLISAIVGLIFCVLILFKSKIKNRNSTIIVIISLILILVLISCYDIIYSNLFISKVIPDVKRVIPNVKYFSLMNAKNMSVNIRLKLYSSAWQLIKQKPLFGLGTGGFQTGGRQYPHNIFLEIAVENGLLGLVIFLYFLFTVCQRGYQFLNKNIINNYKQAKIIGLIVLVVGISLFIERQFSFRLDMHKDLFVFFGLIINLPSLNHSYKMKDISGELINDKI